MNNIVQKCVLSGGWRATVTSVRYRRVNVQRPRAPHFERAKVLELVKPLFQDPAKTERLPQAVSCLKPKELLQQQYRPDNPYEKIVAKEIQCWFNKSKLIAFLHTNPISGEDKFWANIKLKREDMHLRVFPHNVMKLALDSETYSPVHQLFKVHQAIIFCKETKVDKLLKLLKKMPQYILMAAIVEGKMLSVSQLVSYSKLKDITMARAQLAATLCLAQSRVISNLSHHQSTLIHQLKHLADNMSHTSSNQSVTQPITSEDKDSTSENKES